MATATQLGANGVRSIGSCLRFGNGDQMAQIDRYMRLRLALFVSKKLRRRGITRARG